MTSPYRGHDPETPPGAEAALQEFSDALESARKALKAARDAEVTAQEAHKAALRRTRLSPECPKAGVFDGVRVTVAYVNDWVEDQCADEEMEWLLARAARQAASDHLRTLSKQGSIQQSISNSVSQSYRQSSGSGRW